MSYAGLTRCGCGASLQPPASRLRYRCPACDRVYGQIGRPSGSTTVAAPAAWKTEAWKGPVRPVTVDGPSLPEHLERIRWGFVPREMEERWFIVADGNEVRFLRSWTGQLCYAARLTPTGIPNLTLPAELKGQVADPEFVHRLIDPYLVGDPTRAP